jgi:hypothetical protein
VFADRVTVFAVRGLVFADSVAVFAGYAFAVT